MVSDRILTTVSEQLSTASGALSDASGHNAMREARLLMAKVLGIPVSRMALVTRDGLSPDQYEEFWGLVNRRVDREPVSHILGGREFFGRWFEINSSVLDPRPDTETLIVAALSTSFTNILDLGTGSGVIAITLLAERPSATGIAIDLSRAALEIAQRNAGTYEVSNRLALSEGSWFDSVAGQFDLIVSNPPYISLSEMDGIAPELSFEPRMALTDEGDGLSAYRIITAGASERLTKGGYLMVEIGWKQGQEVRRLFEQAGFSDVVVHHDLDGRDRVISGMWR